MEDSLTQLSTFTQTGLERDTLIQQTADNVHAFFIQREMMGMSNHAHAIEHYKIPKEVLSKVGVRPSKP